MEVRRKFKHIRYLNLETVIEENELNQILSDFNCEIIQNELIIGPNIELEIRRNDICQT